MKKTLALFLILALCQTLSAQEKSLAVSGGVARTAALGGGPTNPYITDYSDIYINPAEALRYIDLLYADIGYQFAGYKANGQGIGFTLGTSGIAIGIAVGHEEGPMYQKNSYGVGTNYAYSDYMMHNVTPPGGTATVMGEPLAPVQVYAGFKLGYLTLGAAFYRAGWSESIDQSGSGTAKASNHQTGFKAGTIIGDENTYLDASLLMRFNGSSAEYSFSPAPANGLSSGKYSVTGTEFGVNARFFMPLIDKLTIVPIGRYYTFAYEPEYSQTPAAAAGTVTKPNAYSRNELEIGVGANTAVKGGMVTIGLSMQRISLSNDVTAAKFGKTLTEKQKCVWFDLPKINVGAELALNSWATARFGYFKRFSTVTETIEEPAGWSSATSPSVTTESSQTLEAMYAPALGMANSTDQQLSLGLGLTYDRIALDGYIADQMIGDMPYILSGKANGVFCVLSMSYKF
ncbi:MAG: hypothetical protein NTV54_08250 [Ignavibacteriales bacterium]|nr:hypothetical protein [Ignavibacteriales bacterium]